MILLLAALLHPAELVAPPRPVAAATVTSSLTSAPGGIRQFAFDTDNGSAFVSTANPTDTDHLTLTFDMPVKLRAIKAVTGRADGTGVLPGSALEVSPDGVTFTPVADAFPLSVQAIRVRPGVQKVPLIIRDFEIDSDLKIARFRYPVEFTVNTSDAPELREWTENVARVCERQYTMICDELASPGYKPPTTISLTLKNDYAGVAYASGSNIVGAVKYFQAHPKDVGAFVHETAHCVQGYRFRRMPSWLVEGVADYVRYWKYEPEKGRQPRAGRARYDGSYGITAAFLKSVSDRYDPLLVQKLNAMMRQGKYDPAAWKTITGKSVEELGQEWRQSLKD